MILRPSRILAGVVSFCALALGVGCGGDAGDEGIPALTGPDPLGEGGTLTWIVRDRFATLDPLEAATRADQLVSRQINEPLTARSTAPFDESRSSSGLAVSSRPSGDNTIWTLRLREGVRFQDGEPFNGSAVGVNATRWQTTTAGRELLPDLVSVASPKPDLVKFILSSPDPRFPQRLSDPRLGIVSPRALQPESGSGAILGSSTRTGTGAFQLLEGTAEVQLLARNGAWWGAGVGADLGPALDRIEFRSEPSATLRLALLDAGDAHLADELGCEQATLARTDPLLTVLAGESRTSLGLERSVRGVDSALEIPALSGAWLTSVRVAE